MSKLLTSIDFDSYKRKRESTHYPEAAYVGYDKRTHTRKYSCPYCDVTLTGYSGTRHCPVCNYIISIPEEV